MDVKLANKIEQLPLAWKKQVSQRLKKNILPMRNPIFIDNYDKEKLIDPFF